MSDLNKGKSELRLLREAAALTRSELGRRIRVSERQIYSPELKVLEEKPLRVYGLKA